MFYEILCRNCIFNLMHFSDKNILQNNIFAHNIRNIVCSCKNIFNDYSFDILFII